jgi:hypothetical protein
MLMAAVFLDIEKAFNKTWRSGLLYKLSELEFSTSLIKLIASFLIDRNFKVLVGGKLFMPRKIVAGLPQGSVHGPILFTLHINNKTDLVKLQTFWKPDQNSNKDIQKQYYKTNIHNKHHHKEKTKETGGRCRVSH